MYKQLILGYKLNEWRGQLMKIACEVENFSTALSMEIEGITDKMDDFINSRDYRTLDDI